MLYPLASDLHPHPQERTNVYNNKIQCSAIKVKPARMRWQSVFFLPEYFGNLFYINLKAVSCIV
jgi:hypothetical protein